MKKAQVHSELPRTHIEQQPTVWQKYRRTGRLALAAAAITAGVLGGPSLAKEIAHTGSADRTFQPAAGDQLTRSTVTTERVATPGISTELRRQVDAELQQMQSDETTPRFQYTVKDGNSPAGIVETMLVENGSETVGVTDTVDYNADVEFMKMQAAQYDGMFHPGDTVVLPPGTNIPGQTSPVALPGQ